MAKTLRQKYLDNLQKNRTKEIDLDYWNKHNSFDRFAKQLESFYLKRTAGYLSDGCYHTSRKNGAQ